jgi:hypothetical protein
MFMDGLSRLNIRKTKPILSNVWEKSAMYAYISYVAKKSLCFKGISYNKTGVS